MALFWYPQMHMSKHFEKNKFDKGYMLDSYVKYYLARLQSAFKYDGLPDSVPAKWLEHYLLTNGNCIFTKVDDTFYAFTGGQCEVADAYYVPQGYVVANPWVKVEGGTLSRTFWISDTDGLDGSYHEQDAVLMRNDTYSQGVLPLLTKYCTQLLENDITLQLADILARATINISCSDDRTKASAEEWLNKLYDGKLGIMSETAFIEGLNIREFSNVASSIIPLIEYQQYIKANMLNDLGLNANYNMKREAINSNESQLNDDMLRPFIDDMLKMRREAVEEINRLFGLDITVTLDSAWMSNAIEENATLLAMVDAIDSGIDETTPEEIPTNAEGDTNDIDSDSDITDNSLDTEDDVTEENGTGQLEEDETSEAVEDLVEAAEELAEELTGGEDDEQTSEDAE